MKKVVNNVELKLKLYVGRGMLSWAIHTLNEYCNHYGYKCSIEKGFGILRVPLIIKIRLPYEDWKVVVSELKDIFS